MKADSLTELHKGSRLKGAVWHKRKTKWQASLKIGKKRCHWGYFSTREEAAREAAKEAERKSRTDAEFEAFFEEAERRKEWFIRFLGRPIRLILADQKGDKLRELIEDTNLARTILPTRLEETVPPETIWEWYRDKLGFEIAWDIAKAGA
jgi:hypothetical protein